MADIPLQDLRASMKTRVKVRKDILLVLDKMIALDQNNIIKALHTDDKRSLIIASAIPVLQERARQATAALKRFWGVQLEDSSDTRYLGLIRATVTCDADGKCNYNRTLVPTIEDYWLLHRKGDSEHDFFTCYLLKDHEADTEVDGSRGRVPTVDLQRASIKEHSVFKRIKEHSFFIDRELVVPKGFCEHALTVLMFLMCEQNAINAIDLSNFFNCLSDASLPGLSRGLPKISEDFLFRDMFSKDLIAAPTLYNSVTSIACGSDEDPWVKSATFRAPARHVHFCASESLPKSTVDFAFPGPFPETKLEHPRYPFYMDIWKPHGKIPSTDYRGVIWGSEPSANHGWTSISFFGSKEMARSFEKRLRTVVQKYPKASQELVTHWTQIIGLIFPFQLQSTALRLRDALVDLEKFRLSNLTRPSDGAAHTCVMYLNHLASYKRTMAETRNTLESLEARPFPANSSGARPWLASSQAACDNILKEIEVVSDEIEEIKATILQQLEISRNGRTSILTVLASLFILASFVAALFGMNTKEINDSAWPIKYYLISAIPLSAISIFLPLCLIWTISVVVRRAHPVAMLLWPATICAAFISVFSGYIRDPKLSDLAYISRLIYHLLVTIIFFIKVVSWATFWRKSIQKNRESIRLFRRNPRDVSFASSLAQDFKMSSKWSKAVFLLEPLFFTSFILGGMIENDIAEFVGLGLLVLVVIVRFIRYRKKKKNTL